MGADYVALVGCPLEEKYGPESLFMRLKAAAQVEGLIAQREAYESATGKKLEDASITIAGMNNEPRQITFKELSALAESVARCEVCESIFGTSRGAYRYITYPIDAAFERSVFEYVVTILRDAPPDYVTAKDAKGNPLTAPRLIYDFVIEPMAQMDQKATYPRPFKTSRGPNAIVELGAPLAKQLPAQGITLDSAQVLAAAFHPIDGTLALKLFAAFYRDYVRFIDAKKDAPSSRTIEEVRSLADFMKCAVVASSVRNVTVVFDG